MDIEDIDYFALNEIEEDFSYTDKVFADPNVSNEDYFSNAFAIEHKVESVPMDDTFEYKQMSQPMEVLKPKPDVHYDHQKLKELWSSARKLGDTFRNQFGDIEAWSSQFDLFQNQMKLTDNPFSLITKPKATTVTNNDVHCEADYMESNVFKVLGDDFSGFCKYLAEKDKLESFTVFTQSHGKDVDFCVNHLKNNKNHFDAYFNAYQKKKPSVVLKKDIFWQGKYNVKHLDLALFEQVTGLIPPMDFPIERKLKESGKIPEYVKFVRDFTSAPKIFVYSSYTNALRDLNRCEYSYGLCVSHDAILRSSSTLDKIATFSLNVTKGKTTYAKQYYYPQPGLIYQKHPHVFKKTNLQVLFPSYVVKSGFKFGTNRVKAGSTLVNAFARYFQVLRSARNVPQDFMIFKPVPLLHTQKSIYQARVTSLSEQIFTGEATNFHCFERKAGDILALAKVIVVGGNGKLEIYLDKTTLSRNFAYPGPPVTLVLSTVIRHIESNCYMVNPYAISSSSKAFPTGGVAKNANFMNLMAYVGNTIILPDAPAVYSTAPGLWYFDTWGTVPLDVTGKILHAIYTHANSGEASNCVLVHMPPYGSSNSAAYVKGLP
jgi:hypothetical protein